MKLGFITNCFAWAGMNDLDRMAEWAAANGFEDMEAGPSIPLDEKLFEAVKEKHGVSISTLIYCRNLLDPVEGPEHIRLLKDRIVFAGKTGADKVVCTTGVSAKTIVDNNPQKLDPEASLDEVAELFGGILELAHKHNVRIAFEICPFMYNIAHSPYMWEKLFKRLDSPLVGIVFDPSHLVWQFIDALPLIRQYSDRIFHVHGKDCEILPDVLNRMGILHTVTRHQELADHGEGLKEYEHSWFRYRLPGHGDLNWQKLVSDLQITGYDGTISIEHEDPVWSGSIEKVQKGLILSRDFYSQYL